MLDVLKQQYSFIRSTREILFTFLEEIPLQKLHSTVPNFGSGSIIKTHIHVADCYRYWLGSFAFNQRRADFSFATDYEIEHSNVEKVRARFELADEIVKRFLDEFNARWFENIANEVKWQKEPWSTTPLWLLTHTETHEFHHKGQIVSMARHLGYIPPNTDLD
ncbi:DinB family protein [Bacillus pseudomycoides]|uniref:Damage-inducible protein DinB n=1 Tax=Bacillus pseudomycoides TaxID=64104 RepID=A0A2B6RZY2_9BACI|nr:DinB family protein [Bacillus pseudomycoides]PDY46806.1 damage-inducible protein DinB [Bacillus pseudomycoides]PEA80373.1 damage-inducible protein DinB [Bacillus pseudomycoides]PED73548.1 damage-inducible protein DinB [Bacillus pseudomycoides]PEI46776.1 damage-inducible protein DinB [Bacillus pseudomycoides]PEJ68150.1 damage-inducible protein DinB [Bacillus pseudomycoides]